jgi:hypothetical protein
VKQQLGNLRGNWQKNCNFNVPPVKVTNNMIDEIDENDDEKLESHNSITDETACCNFNDDIENISEGIINIDAEYDEPNSEDDEDKAKNDSNQLFLDNLKYLLESQIHSETNDKNSISPTLAPSRQKLLENLKEVPVDLPSHVPGSRPNFLPHLQFISKSKQGEDQVWLKTNGFVDD